MSDLKRPSSMIEHDTGLDPTVEPDSKRRPSRTEPRRRFECTYAGCGRNYSRAEHLYRHQLNHNPKEIYKCDFPGCARTFVRQDLCIRHRERHENRGKPISSQQSTSREPLSPRSSLSDGGGNSPSVISPGSNFFTTPRPPSETIQSPTLTRSAFPEASPVKPTDVQAIVQQSQLESSVTGNQSQGNQDRQRQPNPPTSLSGRSPSRNYRVLGLGSDQSITLHRSHSMSENTFENVNPSMLNKIIPRANSGSRVPTMTDHQMQDKGSAVFAINGLNEQHFNDSPVSVRDEFTAWLFEDGANLQSAHFPISMQSGLGFPNTSDAFGNGIYSSYFADPALDNAYPGIMQQQRPMENLNKATEIAGEDNLISHAKRKSLVSLMEKRFNESDNPFIRQLREEIFRGNLDAEEHVLSIRSMQNYLGSYFYHFHAQMPILHQPTFSADEIHEYLLLAVMAIGAAYLNRIHGRAQTDAAARLATFIAWHLRWQVFMNNDFHPPAKLWVFQTLLLLEIYEKMNATRILHERSHIHYATTINLMRRGTALIETATQEPSRAPKTPEEWWSRWITAEATRRAAYAAFYLDAVHATMFGHAAMMVVHEIRLPLPCDDALWSATSAAEVGRVEASLHANGIKPTTFLDGLKKTLTGRKVRTNNFGRMILMAGIISVSWHMNQRDLQVSSLGVSQTMGVPEWRIPLTKAFEFWKKDFDENIEHMRRATLPWQKVDVGVGDEDIAKTAKVLYSLSHMALHVDIFDHQIFAGIKKLFGRTVTNADYERVKCKIFDWAKGPSSRVAVFHALQLLRDVMLPGKDGTRKFYNARDDILILRPWAVYFAALIVWSYGFALDGVLRPFPTFVQPANSPGSVSIHSHSPSNSLSNVGHEGSELHMEAVVKDAQLYLQTVGAVKTPHQLETMKEGRNNVVGVLTILETSFKDSRWELLHEAAGLLRNAIALLKGASRA